MTETPNGRCWVLVIEDNAAEAQLIIEAFATVSADVDLTCVTTGSAALECLRANAGNRRPALTLVDNHLPDTRGSELAALLAADPQYGFPRMVLLSGDRPRDYAGAWEDWLKKPASWQEWERLARALTQRFLIDGAEGSLLQR